MTINLNFKEGKFILEFGENRQYCIDKNANDVEKQNLLLFLYQIKEDDIIQNNIKKTNKTSNEEEKEIYRKSDVIYKIINNYIEGYKEFINKKVP